MGEAPWILRSLRVNTRRGMVGLESPVLIPDAVGIQPMLDATRPEITSPDNFRSLEFIHQNILKSLTLVQPRC